MAYRTGRHNTTQTPLGIVRFSRSKWRIGNQDYDSFTKGFDPFLARQMIDAGISAGRDFYRKEKKQPGSIRVYNLQRGRFEVEID